MLIVDITLEKKPKLPMGIGWTLWNYLIINMTLICMLLKTYFIKNLATLLSPTEAQLLALWIRRAGVDCNLHTRTQHASEVVSPQVVAKEVSLALRYGRH